MKFEVRRTLNENRESIIRGLILIAESEEESEYIDAVFGDKPNDDGLIGIRRAEARLSGYGEHYIYISASGASSGGIMEDKNKSIKEMVIEKEKEGKVVLATWDGLMEADLESIIKQPTEGLLYDLNRDKATVLTFISDENKVEKWVNDYACGLVIAKLKEIIDNNKIQATEKSA